LRAEATAGRVSQALVKFGSLFGTATGQIPPGATIQSARLRFTTLGAAGPAARLFRLLQPFGTGTTWASGYGGNGVQPYGLEARAAADRVVSPATAGTHAVDVTTSLRDWAAGGVNHGWLLESAGIGAWSLASSEYTVAAARLRLEVTWTPAASSLASAPISVAPTASARLPFGIETLWAAVAWSDSPSTPRSFRSGSVR
jgi:hypothetical protein